MLAEISCDKFIENGKVRDPIVFHEGLNTVIGSESGTNSIGKSTFLMILDFVFGGEDYISKSREVFKAANVGPHTIKFKFVFDGQPYYFSRLADPLNYKTVIKCNEKYEPLDDGEMTIQQYQEFLAEHYGFTEQGQTWRGCVTRSTRVDRRETLDLDKPLKSYKAEPDRDGIIALIKLYGAFESVSDQLKVKKNAESEESAFKDAQKHEFVPNVKGPTEFKKNAEQIEILEAEINDLADQSSKGLLELTSMQAEQLTEIKNKIAGFKRQRSRLQGQLAALERSKTEDKKSFQKDYRELLEFFPEIDVQKLEQIEQFHRRITQILNGEIRDKKDSLNAMIALASSRIRELEDEQLRISQLPNVEKATLEKYAELQKELLELQTANEAYKKKDKLHKKTERAQETVDEVIMREMAYIESKLNPLLERMNDTLYDVEIKPPLLKTHSADKYEFYTEDDGGSGMRRKGVILLDLGMMQSTKLPFVIHDSVLLHDIENEAIEKILELYERQKPKQVFIAYDKTATPHADEIAKRNQVLHLSRGGNELFGKAWNRKKKDSDDAEQQEQ
jgi:ribosomal protein S21